ncbi:MAG: hypothetical protein JW782_03205 [Candidatus Saganbacteria bacterium]|nr:hypothetical protein [Candidatus Saganbacteria bacterium]
MFNDQLSPANKIILAATLLLALFFALGLLLSCGGPGPLVYRNESYGFAVTYPKAYKIREFSFNGEQTGAEFNIDFGSITIRAMAAGTIYKDMKFDDYVLIAAASEIQNFQEIASYRKFRSLSGVHGYETFWEVSETIPPDEWSEGLQPQKKIFGPIYYFPPRAPKLSGAQPVKTIMLSYYAKSSGEAEILVKKDLTEIARSFRYLSTPDGSEQ